MTPEKPFEEPWHAQIFALTVALSEAGHFEWREWAEDFGATLARRSAERPQNGAADYYDAWLETLEPFLAERSLADPAAMVTIRADWEQAYLSTPHGQPVWLKR